VEAVAARTEDANQKFLKSLATMQPPRSVIARNDLPISSYDISYEPRYIDQLIHAEEAAIQDSIESNGILMPPKPTPSDASDSLTNRSKLSLMRNAKNQLDRILQESDILHGDVSIALELVIEDNQPTPQVKPENDGVEVESRVSALHADRDDRSLAFAIEKMERTLFFYRFPNVVRHPNQEKVKTILVWQAGKVRCRGEREVVSLDLMRRSRSNPLSRG
jgi:hypothetical protein